MKSMHFEALINFLILTSSGSVFLIDDTSHAVSARGEVALGKNIQIFSKIV